MAETKPDLAVTDEWADLVETYDDLAGVPAYVQNKDQSAILVFFGGEEAPEGTDGILLVMGAPERGTADHIWVRARSEGETAVVGCGLADA